MSVELHSPTGFEPGRGLGSGVGGGRVDGVLVGGWGGVDEVGAGGEGARMGGVETSVTSQSTLPALQT